MREGVGGFYSSQAVSFFPVGAHVTKSLATQPKGIFTKPRKNPSHGGIIFWLCGVCQLFRLKLCELNIMAITKIM
jgi:hypothetical protein